MADLLTYAVVVAPPTDSDVVTRVFSVDVNGENKGATSFAGNSVDLGTVTVPQNAEVVLTLVDVDDAGNSSVPAFHRFVAVDTLPPAQPGGFVLTLVGEKAVPEVTPAPEVTPEPEVTPDADA